MTDQPSLQPRSALKVMAKAPLGDSCCFHLPSPFMLTSEVSGLGCLASSRRRADRRSARAVSAAPKMLATLRWLLSFFVLDLALLAILTDFNPEEVKIVISG